MGGGPKSTQSSTTTPTLYSWKELLPPWVQAGQRALMPSLFQRYYAGGLTPEQMAVLSGSARSQIENAATTARQNLAGRMASQGVNLGSPAWAGGLGDIEAERLGSTQRMAMDLAKAKIGAMDTATQQLLTALYTPPPAAVGQTTTQSSKSSGGK